MTDDIKKLELRITELENKLQALQGPAASIDPEDLKTYHRVSQQLGMSGPSEQIKICSVCNICYRCIRCVCINECVCGPCNVCIIAGGTGAGRFEGLG